MKFYMFRTVLLSIIRSFLLYTKQWYMSYRFADILRAGSGCSILILLAFMVIHKDNKSQALIEPKGNYPVYMGAQCDTNIDRFNSGQFLTQTLFLQQFNHHITRNTSTASNNGVIKPKCISVSCPTHGRYVLYPTHLSFASMTFQN
jgi:hypothetical protein